MFHHEHYEDFDTITIYREAWVDGLSDYVKKNPLTRWSRTGRGWQIKVRGSEEERKEAVVWITKLHYGFRPTKEEYAAHWQKLKELRG